MIFKENFKMGLKDIDINNKIKNVTLLEFFENIGAYHSDMVKFGANEIEETKASWILMDWKIKVIKRPKYGENLEVHTWCKDGGKMHTYRDFELYNEKGELCAIGTSKWVLIDIETGVVFVNNGLEVKEDGTKTYVLAEYERDKNKTNILAEGTKIYAEGNNTYVVKENGDMYGVGEISSYNY